MPNVTVIDVSVIVMRYLSVMLVIHPYGTIMLMIVVMMKRRCLQLSVMLMQVLVQVLMLKLPRMFYLRMRLMIMNMSVMMIMSVLLFLLGNWYFDNLVDRVNVFVFLHVRRYL